MKDRMNSTKKAELLTFTLLSEREKTLWSRLLRDARSIAQREHLMKTWGGWSYQVHLDRTDDVLVDFGYGEPTVEGYQRRVAMQFHDIIEDCGWSYNDVKSFVKDSIGTKWNSYIEIANIAFALTDEKGKNRKTRKPDELYEEMVQKPDYVICKLADRIVNLERDGSMGKQYAEEYADFRKKLYRVGWCDNMWEHLDSISGFNPKKK